ncbi:ATP-grasp domain-containing protein [Roseovarius sp. B08]|uniref:ATP-grasp domain-containing protein n=1 Tax=Roseovarius sp. B08 TaxID=3449223 RepID=UPI003EDBD369
MAVFMSSEEYAIAVGSAGSATGLGVLRSLACWDRVASCLACDINPSHLVAAATEFEFLRVLPATSADFAETLADEFSWKGIKAYYPIHDVEIAAASSERALFAARGITLLAPRDDSISIVRDKLRMAEVLIDANVPTPKTTRLDLAQWDGTALHIKPRTGVGSHGAIAIHDADSFASYQASSDAELLIAQPFIAGDEITIDAFCPEPGKVQAIVCRERVEVKAGVSTKARIFVDQELTDLTGALSKALGLTGSFCHQVRGTATEGWQVIDVNPRVGGGTAMSVAAGLDFPSAHAAHFLGHDPTEFFTTLPNSDVFVTRSFREHVAWQKNP